MKNLFLLSHQSTFSRFIFQNNAPKENTEAISQKEQYEKASEISWNQFKKEHKRNHQKSVQEAYKDKDTPEWELKMLEADLPDESEYLDFQENPSFVYPQSGDSWYKLIKESNAVNSAKLTAKNSTDGNPDIWNLLQTDQNLQKVANHLEKKFGKLKNTDAVGIWFNEKTQKTMIYFERDGERYSIPFNEIK